MAVIAWIVYITYTNVNRKQSKTVLSAELQQHQTVEVAAVTPLDISETSIISTTTYDAVDRVGLLCSLTTMLFFAAPFSNLVSVKTHKINDHIYIYINICCYQFLHLKLL